MARPGSRKNRRGNPAPAGEAATQAHAGVQAADQQLDALAVAYAAKNGVTFEQAYDKITQQPEGAALYAKYVVAQIRLI